MGDAPDDGVIEDVRLAVYRAFADTGRAPGMQQLAARLDVSIEEVDKALVDLHERRHLVLGEGQTIVMAHPFASIPLGFSVMGRETLWWGGCAWDSFALPHLLRPTVPEALAEDGTVLVATRCRNCDRPHAWNVGTSEPPPGDQVAHFLLPTARMWDDVVHTCANQRIFCDEACVETWLERTGHDRGYAMDLDTLWRFASGWYAGRLDRGYQRREPSSAAEYLRSVGLTGPFWGVA